MKTLKLMLGMAIVAASILLLAASGTLAQSAEVTWTDSSVNVTTATTAVLAANVERKFAFIQNISDTNITCEIDGSDAVLNEGFTLVQYGSMQISPGLDNYTTEAINCIHGGSGNKVMNVIEGQ